MTGMPPEGTWVVYFIRAVGSNGFEFWSRVKGGRRRWAWDMRGIVDRVLLDRVLVGPLDMLLRTIRLRRLLASI